MRGMIISSSTLLVLKITLTSLKVLMLITQNRLPPLNLPLIKLTEKDVVRLHDL